MGTGNILTHKVRLWVTAEANLCLLAWRSTQSAGVTLQIWQQPWRTYAMLQVGTLFKFCPKAGFPRAFQSSIILCTLCKSRDVFNTYKHWVSTLVFIKNMSFHKIQVPGWKWTRANWCQGSCSQREAKYSFRLSPWFIEGEWPVTCLQGIFHWFWDDNMDNQLKEARWHRGMQCLFQECLIKCNLLCSKLEANEGNSRSIQCWWNISLHKCHVSFTGLPI